MDDRSQGLLAALVLTGLLASGGAAAATLPAGFTETVVASPRTGGSWSQPVGLTFSTTGRMFVWEKGGRVWIAGSTPPVPQPFFDINEEVLNWGDHGMLGFALHPDFNSTGYVYAMYTVDRNHLINCDSPRDGIPVCGAGYVPANTWLPTDSASPGYLKATIARIVRYRAVMPAGDADYRNATTVDYGSRRVLVGDTLRSLPKSGGIPLTHDSHGHGSLVFGQDGTLLASTGDNASYASTDSGSAAETYYASAVTDGIMRTEENVGAFRSQMVNSLAGKVLRLDPETGNGLPGNPFYSAAAPRAAGSRVWALGLRNPYRMTHRPGTGDHDPAAANPGSLYLGDVGLNTWEEMNIIRQGGSNYGWPLFEGMFDSAGYPARTTRNADALNPLANPPTCPATIMFRDLIKQEVATFPSFPNPCDSSVQLPPAVTVFEHARPELAWNHSATNPTTLWPAFFPSGLADTWPVGETGGGRTVTGNQFGGNASIGGVWYQGTAFPPQYRNTYFAADYGLSWIRSFSFDSQDRVLGVSEFATNAGEIVALGAYPPDGHLYYVGVDGRVRRISYTPNEPVALAAATPVYGTSPLQVSFVGSGSYDPQGQPLTYLWNFGDGTTSSAQNPVKTFTVSNGLVQNFVTSLTVTDVTALTSQAFVSISVNNTPPTVRIASPVDGGLYSLVAPTQITLTSQVSDQESPNNP
ncbi:MAG: PQQ-dependent sugar dehydrogenase, partial [Gammaproteobacteria bacterium]|nr:PQQ-dependent sugar dehydrogenase [Gammaproteobacteria bacterium]